MVHATSLILPVRWTICVRYSVSIINQTGCTVPKSYPSSLTVSLSTPLLVLAACWLLLLPDGARASDIPTTLNDPSETIPTPFGDGHLN